MKLIVSLAYAVLPRGFCQGPLTRLVVFDYS